MDPLPGFLPGFREVPGSRWDLVTMGDRAGLTCSALGCWAGCHAHLPPVDITHVDFTCLFPAAPGWEEG